MHQLTRLVGFSLPVLVGLALVGCSIRTMPEGPATTSLESMRAADLSTQVAQYVRAQEALAADDFSGAQTALTSLTAIADNTVLPLAEAAAAASDIATMRAEFKPLSEFLAAMDLPAGFARAHCPMYDGGSNWVQTDGPVRNPYYGNVMLTCGVIDGAPGAHMDHGPRHGGRVFMAPDSFHHIEGAYPEAGVFRLYATDNYREPVDVTFWMGRVVLEEEYDPDTDEFIEVKSFPLLPSPDGAYLEAEVGELSVPAEFITKIQLVEDYPEDRFDFIFSEYSTTALAADAAVSPPPDAPGSLPLAERIRPRIPEATSDLVADIGARNEEIRALVAEGGFTEIFIPALQSKELALALHDRADTLSVRDRNNVRIAVRSLVRAAWLLDWYGDLGNKQQVSDAYDILNEAVIEIDRVYSDTNGR